MGAKIFGFILYLALSYGVIYALISKQFQSGWIIGEQRVRAAVLIAMAVIIAVGTMLVGPLPMVLLVVALVAFIDYIRSSETLAATAGVKTPDRRLLPSLIGSIGWLKRELTIASADRGVDRVRLLAPSLLGSIASLKRTLATASAHHGVDRMCRLAPSLLGSIVSLKRTLATASAHHGVDGVRHLAPSLLGLIASLKRMLATAHRSVDRIRGLVFPAARRALAVGVTRLSGHVRSLTRKSGSDGDLNACSANEPPAAPTPPDQVQPPPPLLTLAEGHGLYAVRTALGPPKPAGRTPTRDEAKRLLDHLEGWAFEAPGPAHPNTNQVRDNLARSLSDKGHADEALADSQAAEASHLKVLGPDHDWSKHSADLSTRRQCVVEGNEGPPLRPPKLSTTTNEVGNETKSAGILARSKLEKAQRPDPIPNLLPAKAEATEIQRKFEEVWTLYEERGKSRGTGTSASSSSQVRAASAVPWRPTLGKAAR
jgi:hypothetical protein